MKVKQFSYQVSFGQNGPITISVIIGDAQIGGGVVLLDSELLSRTPVENYSIGNYDEIKSKKCLFKTIVSDENPSTNRTSVTYLFKRNGEEISHTSEAEVAEEGDAIAHYTEITIA